MIATGVTAVTAQAKHVRKTLAKKPRARQMSVRSLRLSLNRWVKTALQHAHTSSVPSKRQQYLQQS